MTVTAFDVISPSDEKILTTVHFAGRSEVDARVDRAHRAFAAWEAGNVRDVLAYYSAALAFVGAVLDPLRRVQAVRSGPGTRPGRPPGLH